MAAISSLYPLGSPQEHIPICEKHDLMIDLTCENCGEFICSQCAKRDHKDHDWKTISTAAAKRRRELKESLFKMKGEGMRKMDEKIQKVANQIENDQNCCDFDVANLQKHHDVVMFSLAEIKRNYTKTLKDNLEEKNAEDSDNEEEKHLIKYENYGAGKELLKLIMGCTSDLNNTFYLSETESFQYGDKPIDILEAVTNDTCFVRESDSEYIKEIQFESNENSEQFVIRGIDICLYNTFDTMSLCVERDVDAYVTNRETNSIVCQTQFPQHSVLIH